VTSRDREAAGQAADAARDPVATLGRRNERLLMVGVVGYSAVVVLLMFLRGIEITPDVMAVAFGLGAVMLGRGRLFLRDWLPFVALFLAYELMRGLADNVGLPVHVTDMVTAERLVSLGHIPSQVLQDAFHPATGVDLVAEMATVVYMLHFALPLVTGFILWVWRRAHYYDYVAALIFVSLWGFVTFVLIPTAPPWYAAQVGALVGPNGHAAISYLKPGAFDTLANFFGFKADYIYTYTFYDVNPNAFAAWPSLHVAYPFLSFLLLRRAFGRIGWVGFVYTALVAFSVMYTGDHWLIDVIGGVSYAYVSYYAVTHAPAFVSARLARLRDDALTGGSWTGVRDWVTTFGSSVSWVRLGIGLVLAFIGWSQVRAMEQAGHTGSWAFLVPWAVLFAGFWLVAVGVIRRPRRAPVAPVDPPTTSAGVPPHSDRYEQTSEEPL
jgi:membrane-associated phospholipid phosphatase